MAATCVRSLVRPRVGMLIASPDPHFRQRWLMDSAHTNKSNQEVEGGAHALAKLSECDCDRVVLDKGLLDLDASEVAEVIRRQYPRTSVEMVDSRTKQEKSVVSPETSGQPGDSFAAAPETEPTAQENQEASAGTVAAIPGMIGNSRAMREMYQMIRMVAQRDTTVLLAGETGTGKELAANAIHQLSSRANQPFVPVNCAAIPEALLESELFGHVRGAFTGAVQSRLGRIHVAHGGTLFLDEIGDLPIAMQSKLLRFLQNGEVQRLGSSDVYRMDVRVICATNVRLAERIQMKQFRQDLYYRLAVFPISLPPLRQRLVDLESLAEHFLEKLSADADAPLKRLSPEAMKTLMARKWHGNVRELQHALERAFILSGNSSLLEAEHCQELSDPDFECC
jgi:transcriptional regulator with GAF, ATPase, and Fis domain